MLKQFHEIQEKLDDLSKLRLDCNDSIILLKSKTVKQFVKNFFKIYNDKYHTIYVKANRIQTYRSKTRSAHDLYRITKYYFPEVTYEDIHIVLEKMAFEVQLVGENCITVGEHVYSSVEARPGWVLSNCSSESHGSKFNEPKFHSQFVQKYKQQKLASLYRKKGKRIYFNKE